MKTTLSIHEARKLALLSQRVPPSKQTGSARAATLTAIEHLGYIQIDTISVIQRAHHHTLWNRNPRYQLNHLDQLVAEKQVFEYWAHAAAYLPMRDYRFSLVRKQAIASGEQEHWFERNPRQEKEVLKRIAAEGPLLARDFEHSGKRTGEWKSKPAKKALENLFMQGDLMSPGRIGFQKLYDLTERVLPANTNTSHPTPREYAYHLINRYLQAHGLGQLSQICYLRPKTKQLITDTAESMVTDKELVAVRVHNQDYYALPNTLNLLSKPLARSKLKILSPFDNLVIQRKRLTALFNFDYQIECYLPAAKRCYGYFALPILWNGKLVARVDCKAERTDSVLRIYNLAIESWLSKTERFVHALAKELKSFAQFNGCTAVRVNRTSPTSVREALRALTKD